MQQMPLIPVSPYELTQSAYRLALLLQELDDANAAFKEARKSHQEHVGALRREISEQRDTIRRAQLESEEGLMGAQIQALLDHKEEQES